MESLIHSVANGTPIDHALNEAVSDNSLNPLLWERKKLKAKIRSQLLKIAKDFLENLKIDIKVSDIIMTGSNANYNWTPTSDIDVHMLSNFKDIDDNADLVHEYFHNMTALWNEHHKIKIFGHEVEVYVQDENEPHYASGIYSLVKNKWNKTPTAGVDPDPKEVKKAAKPFIDDIAALWKLVKSDHFEKAYPKIQKLRDKIRDFRKVALQKGGEYSVGNLAFKELRKGGWMEKLIKASRISYDCMMTMGDCDLAEQIEEATEEIVGIVEGRVVPSVAGYQSYEHGVVGEPRTSAKWDRHIEKIPTAARDMSKRHDAYYSGHRGKDHTHNFRKAYLIPALYSISQDYAMHDYDTRDQAHSEMKRHLRAWADHIHKHAMRSAVKAGFLNKDGGAGPNHHKYMQADTDVGGSETNLGMHHGSTGFDFSVSGEASTLHFHNLVKHGAGREKASNAVVDGHKSALRANLMNTSVFSQSQAQDDYYANRGRLIKQHSSNAGEHRPNSPERAKRLLAISREL